LKDSNRRALVGALIGVAAGAAICGSAAALAQTAHYPKDRRELPAPGSIPDWNGIWERDGDNVWDNRIPVGVPQDPPYNDEYKERVKNGPPGPRGSAFNSMPGWMSMLFPMDVQISPTQVTIMSENKAPRRIYTDGRVHADDTLPSTMGHSTGRWVKGELIVDPASGAPGARPTFDFSEKWSSPKYDYLGEFYSSHVNPIFWRLHGWVDDRIDDWLNRQLGIGLGRGADGDNDGVISIFIERGFHGRPHHRRPRPGERHVDEGSADKIDADCRQPLR